MPIERLQSREEQDQQLDQTHRDASPNKGRGVRDFWMHQCQLNDIQQQEVQQQRKGKELALVEGKDLFNGVAIGEDGKPVEKQIILSERYGKDNPGLAGGVTGILETFGTAAVSWAVKKSLDTLCEFAKNMIMGKKENAEDKLDRLFMSHYQIGLDHLENATMTHDDEWRKGSIREAANDFMRAAGRIQTGCFVKAKSMLSVAGCYHWIHEYDAAKLWLEKAYKEGLAECKRSHSRDELAQFKREFLVPLEKLLQSYPPTSDSTVPLLTQFGRLETGSSSSTSDRVTRDSETSPLASRDKMAIRRQDATDRSILRHPERLTLIRTLTGHTEPVWGAVFSPDGQILATTSYDKTVKLWDVQTWQERCTLTEYPDWINSVVFSPDGQTLATRGGDNAQLWDVQTGQERSTLTGHTGKIWVWEAVFSPDGQTLATTTRGDNAVKLWDVQTGRERSTLTGHTNWISSAVFSPDGQTLATASRDNTIKIWRGEVNNHSAN